MEKIIKVQMTKEMLYDFLLYHTYSKFAGFLMNILGLAVGIMGVILFVTGKAAGLNLAFYLVASVVFLAATPAQLKLRAAKQVKVNPDYCESRTYRFDEAGIHVEQTGKESSYAWEQIHKVVAAPKTFGFYYDADHALIIPKQDFGDQFIEIMKLVTSHVHPAKVRLR